MKALLITCAVCDLVIAATGNWIRVLAITLVCLMWAVLIRKVES